MNPEYTKFQSNGFNLSVKKVYSSDSKPSLLLLHGFNDNKETFYFIEKFLSEYFNLISFDFRGHGDSDWKKEGIYHYAESFLDVHNIAEEYCKEPFYLLGHSMGASIAARYSGLFPERILGLICLEGFIGILPKEYEKKGYRIGFPKCIEKAIALWDCVICLLSKK